MQHPEYFMESNEETLRLEMKIDGTVLQEQARWAGIKPGMRVADLGCGSGKTSFYLHKLVQPNGEVVGVDSFKKRIEYAKNHYSKKGIEFLRKDILEPLEDIGM
ncbi:MAG: methyltransferase domain-containing protein, partial [Desulfobacterales bacterium]